MKSKDNATLERVKGIRIFCNHKLKYYEKISDTYSPNCEVIKCLNSGLKIANNLELNIRRKMINKNNLIEESNFNKSKEVVRDLRPNEMYAEGFKEGWEKCRDWICTQYDLNKAEVVGRELSDLE